MDAKEILEQARDTLTVRRVFGEPIERNGRLVVPVASVRGGAGAGSGEGRDQQNAPAGSGGGGGWGVAVRPAGVYVIDDQDVTWRPALDVNRIVLGGQIVMIFALLVARAALRRRSRKR